MTWDRLLSQVHTLGLASRTTQPSWLRLVTAPQHSPLIHLKPLAINAFHSTTRLQKKNPHHCNHHCNNPPHQSINGIILSPPSSTATPDNEIEAGTSKVLRKHRRNFSTFAFPKMLILDVPLPTRNCVQHFDCWFSSTTGGRCLRQQAIGRVMLGEVRIESATT